MWDLNEKGIFLAAFMANTKLKMDLHLSRQRGKRWTWKWEFPKRIQGCN